MDERVATRSLAERLDAMSAWTAVAAVAVAGLALIAADHAFPSVGMGPLFIPLIALAGWRLGLRASCVVAAVASLLNIFPLHVQELGLDPGASLARGIIRFSAYAFTIALVHALRRAYDRERVQATRDPLTGALNRMAFERKMDALLASPELAPAAVALGMIDVDDFKRINDTHGHRAGDLVLQDLSVGAARALDGQGHFYRLGGDEFAVLIPLASIPAGHLVIEQAHRELSASLARSAFPTTISMGAVVFQPEPSLNRAQLLHEADRHMYLGKLAGKGRVRITTHRPPPVPGASVAADALPYGAART